MRSTACIVLAATLASAASAQTPFTEEAWQRGVAYIPDQTEQFGDGILCCDLDGDRDPDIVAIGAADGTVGVFMNLGNGEFADWTQQSGIPPLELCSAVCAADYDRDGDMDLHISRHDLPDVLLEQVGLLQFVDVAAQAGVDDSGDGYGGGWADYDLDGWIDLYVGVRSDPNKLYRNLGPDQDGIVRFEDVATQLGVELDDDPAFQGSWFDFDHDGDADLYVANDHGTGCAPYTNHLFENIGGAFVEITDNVTSACVSAMCIAIGDFDGNGRQDLFCTEGPAGHALMLNLGEGEWMHAAEEAEVQANQIGWGAGFLDFDNDGHLDLRVCHIFTPNRLFRHDGEWPCEDVSSITNCEGAYESYATTFADIDGDGDLDMVESGRDENIKIYVNHEGEQRSWVMFDVEGEADNRSNIGARVHVQTTGEWQVREVIAGNNYKSQSDLAVHFGLDDATIVERIEVYWPGATVTRTLLNYPAQHRWTLFPPDRLGDHDGDGDQDLDDFAALMECAGGIAAGCEAVDLDGDAVVDAADVDAFLAVFDGEIEDCNLNGIADLHEIFDGSMPDDDGDGRIDTCGIVFADLNADLVVDCMDLLLLLERWGQKGTPADLDADGMVETDDLILLLANWG